MDILVIGGTRFFGITMINELINQGHNVTIATRGQTPDSFGDKVTRVVINRQDEESLKTLFDDQHYDVVIDKIAYCSNDIKKLVKYIDAEQYIVMSSTAIYPELHINTIETDCDTSSAADRVVWQDREDADYATTKLNMERAVFQVLSNRYYKPSPRCIAVRAPYVIGEHDYTNRLDFYVDHIMNGTPMHVDNLNNPISFITEDDAGKFLAHLATSDEAFVFSGPLNAASNGTISTKEIISYIEERTNKKAILTDDGDEAPYNGTPENTINTEFADMLGFKFSDTFTEAKKIINKLISNHTNK